MRDWRGNKRGRKTGRKDPEERKRQILGEEGMEMGEVGKGN